MGQSLILMIEELAPGMSEAFAAHNDAVAAIEEATNLKRTTYDVDAGDLDTTIAELDLVRFMVFKAENALTDYNFILPSEVNANPAKRVFVFWNGTDYTANVTTDTPGATFTVPPGGIVLVLLESVDVFNLGEAGSFFRRESFWADMFFIGEPAASQLLWRHVYGEETTIPQHFTTPGVGTVVFTAQPDDTDTIIINDGFKQVTFEFDSGGGVTAGNTTVTIGGSVDLTAAALVLAINLANISVTATYDTSVDTVTLRNWNGAGGSVSATSASPDFSVTTFSGGTNAARGRADINATLNSYLLAQSLFRTGSILFNAQADDADTLTINDGYTTVVFEFESGGGVSGSNTAVTIGADQDATAVNLTLAINRSALNVLATFDAGTNIVTILNRFLSGGSITKSDVDDDYTVTSWGGSITAFGEIGTIRVNPVGDFMFRTGKRATGTVLFNAQPDDTDTLTINDGFVSVTFEFDNDATVTAPNTAVTIGGDQDATATNLVAAIMVSQLNVEATFDATANLVTLKNGNCTGGAITKVDGDNDYTVTDFAGGIIASTKETGSIVFSSVADVADTVTIFDGVNTTVFSFVTTGNGLTGAAVDVTRGATATDSATNLRAAIGINTNVNVSAGGATTTVTVTNDNYTGGSITKSDADNDYAVTNFSGGSPELSFNAGNALSVRNTTPADATLADVSVTFKFDHELS